MFICGLETAGEVTVRVSVLKDCCMPAPFLVTEDKVMTIQSADTTDEAGKKAVLLMEEYIRGNRRNRRIESRNADVPGSGYVYMSNCRSPDDSSRGISQANTGEIRVETHVKLFLGKRR